MVSRSTPRAAMGAAVVAALLLGAAACGPRRVIVSDAVHASGAVFERASVWMTTWSETPPRVSEFCALGVDGLVRHARARGYAVQPLPPAAPESDLRHFYRNLEHIADETGLPTDSLVVDATRYAIHAVDPNAGLIDPETDGIAAGVAPREDVGVTLFPQAGGPAYMAGLRCGDVVERVDGLPVEGTGQFIEAVRGEEGTRCTLTYRRPGDTGLRTATVTRGRLDTIDPGFNPQFVHSGVAYVKVRAIWRRTGGDLVSTLEMLRGEEPIDAVVLDLREAHGGERFEDVCAVADVFLSSGRIATAAWFNGGDETCRARAPATLSGRRMVVLVGPGTGLGGELLAAALRTNGQAVLLGQETAGAGMPVRPLPVADMQLWMPMGRYLTAAGDALEGRGIEPDVQFDGSGREAVDAAIAYLENTD